MVEAILNSRPITPLSADPNDFSYLSPGHFLVGGPLTAAPEPDLKDVRVNRLSRWQHIEFLRQHIWKQWQQSYLHNCQQRTKWKKNKGTQVDLGSLVLIKESNLPPLKWMLGRVSALHPGEDNVVRVVSIKTKHGELKRAVSRVCVVPIDVD